jgi:hypothetical protein
MKTKYGIILAVALFTTISVPQALAECNISDAKLEEAIVQKPEFRDPANRQMVRDLRRLRDSAFILWTYGRYDDCERLLGNIRELVASPAMGSLGGSDEDVVEQQFAAREPLVQHGGKAVGTRNDVGAVPLIRIDEMSPPLRADEIMGAEVRTSDDKIVGEVRTLLLGAKDRRDYAIVATGGFFVPGKDSIVVPLRFMRVSQERNSFYLPMAETDLKAVPLMPDSEYSWLADEGWLEQNEARFSVAPLLDP